jgi:hypothetical protein
VTDIDTPLVEEPAPPEAARYTLPMLTFDKDGNDGLVLSPAVGIHTTEVDLGYPDVRAVETDRVEHSGVVDRTRHFGARTISINIIAEHPRDALDAIGPYCDPGRLCWLFLDDPVASGTIRRRVGIRADSASAALKAGPGEFQFSWKCPYGVIESAANNHTWVTPFRDAPGIALPGTAPPWANRFTYSPLPAVTPPMFTDAGGDPTGGRWNFRNVRTVGATFRFPFAFPPVQGQQASVVNRGSTDADWTARIYGPVERPTLVNNTTGGSIGLSVDLEAGQMVQLRSDDKSILQDGVAGAYRYEWLGGGPWFKLRPGGNQVALRTVTDIGPTTLEITWRHTFIL